MKEQKIFFLLLLAGIFFPGEDAFSQKDSLRPRLNSIEIFYNDGWFVEGPVNHLHDNGKGISYTRIFGERKWGIELSARHWFGSFRFPADTNYTLPSGFKWGTLTYYFSGAFLWPFLNKNRVKFYGIGDLTFRGGGEDLVSGHSIPELYLEYQEQRDLGVSLGGKFSFLPVKWLSLSTDLRYTRFVYRYYTGDPRYDYDKGTTKNLMTLQLKLGVCF